MTGAFRQSLGALHTWSGLLAGWLLYFVFLTGTLGYFSVEIDRWMQPELPWRPPAATTETILAQAIGRLQAAAPAAERWSIDLPYRKSATGLRVGWRMPTAADGTRGAAGWLPDLQAEQSGVPPRLTGGGLLLYQMHYRLHYLDAQSAYWIVGLASMFLLVTLLSGVITHKRILRNFFTFRPAKGPTSWRDAHTVLGTLALPYHLMITYSGLVLLASTYMPLVFNEIYRADEPAQASFFAEASPRLPERPRSGVAAPLVPLAPVLADARARVQGAPIQSLSIRNPGDANARILLVAERGTPQAGTQQLLYDGVSGVLLQPAGLARSTPRQVRDALTGLHKGLYAPYALRWLYFLAGLVGTAMVGTGLVLWAAKRRERLRAGQQHWGLFAVEHLNPGMILGPVIGVLAYLWANRLLAADYAARGLWEGHALFLAWGAALLWACLSPPRRGWVGLLWCASSLAVLLPVVNALTTDRHLGVTLPLPGRAGDWTLAGVDLAALALGVALACVARQAARGRT